MNAIRWPGDGLPAGEARRFAAFLLTGGTAAAVNFASCLALNALLPYDLAIGLAYLLGMASAFLLARLFVFDRSGRPAGEEFGRFALVNLLAFVQVWIVSVGLAEHVLPAMGFAWNVEAAAHAVGVISPVLTSYLGHRHYTFRTAA